jgi:hypothetical protein
LCVKQDILATLSYFDIFDCPLTQTEIARFLKSPYLQAELVKDLNELTMENWIYKFDEFYSLQADYLLIQRRKKEAIQVRTVLKGAEKLVGFLSALPFVKGVAVSVLPFTNFEDENCAIDFFIITERNKLWLARTLMHCFKKLTLLFKKQSRFRMNYYVDEEMLQIKEKNIYTAIEVATLMPLRGIEAFQDFYTANEWCKDFLPNHGMKVSYLQELQQPVLKRLAEALLNNQFGNFLDNALMKLTTRKWALKMEQKKVNKRGFVLGMDAGKHYAKPRPESFQNKLIVSYEQKLYTLFRSYDNKIQTFY